MRIIWFTWKDLSHPEKGGAEVVTAEITKRLVRDGHEVIILTAGGYDGYKKEGEQNSVKVFRGGNRFTVYWWAYRYYKKNLKDWADVVIDEVNTIPFFTQFYIKKEKRFLFFHQLCREIWFYQIFFPLNWIGYLIVEPLYLWLFRKSKVITVSESTRQDLMRYGFRKENISIISEGVHIKPVKSLGEVVPRGGEERSGATEEVGPRCLQKYKKPTMLSLGAVRKMKRTKHQLRVFEIAKKQIPDLQLKISGLVSDKYGEEFIKEMEESPYKKDIEFMGRVSDEKKEELMQRSHLITVTSLKEGWGLIVTEANSQGTPAVVYEVDGLRDSVRHNKTGLICERNNPENLAENIVKLLQSKEEYDRLRFNAWNWSKEITFEQSYEDFKSILQLK